MFRIAEDVGVRQREKVHRSKIVGGGRAARKERTPRRSADKRIGVEEPRIRDVTKGSKIEAVLGSSRQRAVIPR